jgi:sortase (surface protein transpeptidase)
MEIPTDIRLAGWYDLGVPPGAEVGSAVLVAHRDGRAQGRGVFYSIGSLTIGDKITVIRNDKSKVVYSVASRELIKRKNFAKTAPELFAIDGPHRLTLISCGGTYDRNNGGYQANVIVTALAD